MKLLWPSVLLAALGIALGVASSLAPRRASSEGEIIADCDFSEVGYSGPRGRLLLEEQEGQLRIQTWAGDEDPMLAAQGLAGEGARELWEQLQPLRALRVLAGDAEVSFEGARQLRLGCAESLEFEVSVEAGSHGERYLRRDASAIYVVERLLIEGLERPEARLFRRSLFAFEAHEASSAQIVAGQRRAEGRHHNRRSAQPRWVDVEHPDEEAPALHRMLRSLRRLRIQGGDFGDADPNGARELLEVSYFDGEQRLGRVVVRRFGEGPAAVYFGKQDDGPWQKLLSSGGAAFERNLERWLRESP